MSPRSRASSAADGRWRRPAGAAPATGRASYQRAYFAPALFNLIPVKTDQIASMAGDPIDKGRLTWIKDMAAMFGWFDTGRYVADPRRQEQLFGPVPTAEDALARLTDELGKAQHR